MFLTHKLTQNQIILFSVHVISGLINNNRVLDQIREMWEYKHSYWLQFWSWLRLFFLYWHLLGVVIFWQILKLFRPDFFLLPQLDLPTIVVIPLTIIGAVRSAAVTHCCCDTNIIISHNEWAQECRNGQPNLLSVLKKAHADYTLLMCFVTPFHWTSRRNNLTLFLTTGLCFVANTHNTHRPIDTQAQTDMLNEHQHSPQQKSLPCPVWC